MNHDRFTGQNIIQLILLRQVKNSLIPFSNMDVAKASERLLKLAVNTAQPNVRTFHHNFLSSFTFQIPNHFVWLCFFYLTFHSFLNLVGELLHFADRNFYCDWWNSNNIDTFWRSWNMPVHRWCVRHIYIPIVEMGYNRSVASLIVFFVSAFFHEYLVSSNRKSVSLCLSPNTRADDERISVSL